MFLLSGTKLCLTFISSLVTLNLSLLAAIIPRLPLGQLLLRRTCLCVSLEAGLVLLYTQPKRIPRTQLSTLLLEVNDLGCILLALGPLLPLPLPLPLPKLEE